jgi:hypothetical protein
MRTALLSTVITLRQPGETHMKHHTVDIFKRLPNGKMIWVRAVDGMEEAKVQLKRLVYINPGDYFIYDNRFGGVVPSMDAEPAIFVH